MSLWFHPLQAGPVPLLGGEDDVWTQESPACTPGQALPAYLSSGQLSSQESYSAKGHPTPFPELGGMDLSGLHCGGTSPASRLPKNTLFWSKSMKLPSGM